MLNVNALFKVHTDCILFETWKSVFFYSNRYLIRKTQKRYGKNCDRCVYRLNPLTAKLFTCNFHPLEVVSR